MKKILLSVALIAIAFGQKSLAQNNTVNTQPVQLLTQYYLIKDALVSGSADVAETKATEFIKIANSVGPKAISSADRNALLKDADAISKTNDIDKQRDSFSHLSEHMIALAKTTTLSKDAIYKTYCPMKKVNWLSNSTTIRNPYFGNSMLSCGKIVETLK